MSKQSKNRKKRTALPKTVMQESLDDLLNTTNEDDLDDSSIEETLRLDKRTMRAARSEADMDQLFWVVRVTAGQDMLRFIVLLANDQAWIGREPSNDLQINDRTVSKRHALLLSKPSTSDSSEQDHGRLFLIDEFSTNGTIINRRNRRSRVKKIELQMEDRIELGDVSLVVSLMNTQELNHLKRVVAQLEAANHDPLTGLLTRAFEDSTLPQLVENIEKQGEPISCGFIDLDKFKSVNDTFGHNVGDEVLKNFARIILFHLRNTDYCIRRGGDEFLVFLPGTNEPNAKLVFDRIRIAMQNHSWQKIAKDLNASASFGVAEKDPEDSIEEWINKADKAVYLSKKTGRNKVCSFSDLP